jgi:hypothetical protein
VSDENEASNQIDWQHWRALGNVKVWQALCLSLKIDPKDVDLRDFAEHMEFNRRRARLLPALSDRRLFSPPARIMSDPLRSSVALTEFAAWCITASPPLGYVPADLFLIGHPLAIERQEQARKAAGRYTMEEAAEKLEAAGERGATMLARLKEAAQREPDAKGALPTHEPGREARNIWDDLNRWLSETEPRIGYRFPDPAKPGDATGAKTPSAAIRSTSEWQELARVEATRIRKEFAAKSQFPSLERLGEMVATLFREQAYSAPTGTHLLAPTSSHALQGFGITIGVDRLRPTAKRRGK